MCKILRNVMASAAEAEYGALLLNGQAAVPIRDKLIEVHHPQPTTPIHVDNYTWNSQQKSLKKTLQSNGYAF